MDPEKNKQPVIIVSPENTAKPEVVNTPEPIDYSNLSQNIDAEISANHKLSQNTPDLSTGNIPDNSQNLTNIEPDNTVNSAITPAMVEVNWSGEANKSTPGRFSSHKILYSSAIGLASIALVAGAIFGLYLPNSTPMKKSSDLNQQANSGTTKTGISTKTSQSPSSNPNSQAVAINASKKNINPDPTIPFTNENNDILPSNDAVEVSNLDPQPGDPVVDPDMEDITQ